MKSNIRFSEVEFSIELGFGTTPIVRFSVYRGFGLRRFYLWSFYRDFFGVHKEGSVWGEFRIVEGSVLRSYTVYCTGSTVLDRITCTQEMNYHCD